MTITEGGKKKQISKVEAIVLQLTNQAVSGDRHARQQYIDLHLREDGSELVHSSNSQSDHLQKKLVKSLLKRSERMEEGVPEEPSQAAQEVPLNVIS